MRHLVVVAALVLLAGCTGPEHEATPGPTTSSAGGATSSGTDEAPEEPAPDETGPLEELLGWVADRTADDVVASIAYREEATAACMAAEGFEYWPAVPAASEVTEGTGASPGTPEFVERYGYGVWEAPAEGAGLSVEIDDSRNGTYREGLSAAARGAYDEALMGPVVAEGPGGSITRSGGCSSAYENPGGAAAPTAVREEAVAYLLALVEDPRFGEVDGAWAACMAEAGYTFRSPLAAEESVVTAYGEAVADGQPPTSAETREGAETEQRLAAADHACRAETDWAARHRAIEVQLQQEYVDAHRADLEALTATSTGSANS